MKKYFLIGINPKWEELYRDTILNKPIIFVERGDIKSLKQTTKNMLKQIYKTLV